MRDWLDVIGDSVAGKEFAMKPKFRFAGLDGHEVAVYDVHHVISHTTNGTAVCNLHFNNGAFVSVKGSMDEILAILDKGNKEDAKEEAENWRVIAEHRRKSQLVAQEAIKESGLFSDKYHKKSHTIETGPDGEKHIRITLFPKDHPEYKKEMETYLKDQEALSEKKESDSAMAPEEAGAIKEEEKK